MTADSAGSAPISGNDGIHMPFFYDMRTICFPEERDGVEIGLHSFKVTCRADDSIPKDPVRQVLRWIGNRGVNIRHVMTFDDFPDTPSTHWSRRIWMNARGSDLQIFEMDSRIVRKRASGYLLWELQVQDPELDLVLD